MVERNMGLLRNIQQEYCSALVSIVSGSMLIQIDSVGSAHFYALALPQRSLVPSAVDTCNIVLMVLSLVALKF